MLEMLQYEFVRNALMAAILAGLACGIVGTYVVVKRIVFISGGVAHATFGGIGLGFLLGVDPVLTAIPFGILSALGIGFVSRKTKVSEDTAIGMFWASGMALGVILIGLTPGYKPNVVAYLFGSILMVSHFDLMVMLILDAAILVTFALFHREFLAISFDEEFSEAIGVPTDLIYYIFLSLVALTTILLIRVVGVVLVLALLTIPVAISRRFVGDLKKLSILSAILASALTLLGLPVSYALNLPSGATIVMVLVIAFLLSRLLPRKGLSQ